ncbi:MAG: arginase family protein, partial [Phycisphaerales bacterium]
GLPHTPRDRAGAGIVLVPVPFEATTSYGGGTAAGPGAILRASMQVDLLDHQFGRTYERGIFMERAPGWIGTLSRKARGGAGGGANARDRAAVRMIDAAGEKINAHTHAAAARILAEGKTPGLVGGDHSTPFGFIRACAEHVAGLKGGRGRTGAGGGLGILQVDAHMDFREAYEGFTWSHASIMFNVLERLPQVSRLVQVGIRDYGEDERAYGRAHKGRVRTHFDFDWARRIEAGAGTWEGLCKAAIKPLPRHVYISFDIDGLDPALCPHTGTPVPGGLSFHRACVLLEVLARSGRRIVGFDLNEVSPGLKPDPREPEWDANVGARVLYKLCGAAARASGG